MLARHWRQRPSVDPLRHPVGLVAMPTSGCHADIWLPGPGFRLTLTQGSHAITVGNNHPGAARPSRSSEDRQVDDPGALQ